MRERIHNLALRYSGKFESVPGGGLDAFVFRCADEPKSPANTGLSWARQIALNYRYMFCYQLAVLLN